MSFSIVQINGFSKSEGFRKLKCSTDASSSYSRPMYTQSIRSPIVSSLSRLPVSYPCLMTCLTSWMGCTCRPSPLTPRTSRQTLTSASSIYSSTRIWGRPKRHSRSAWRRTLMLRQEIYFVPNLPKLTSILEWFMTNLARTRWRVTTTSYRWRRAKVIPKTSWVNPPPTKSPEAITPYVLRNSIEEKMQLWL